MDSILGFKLMMSCCESRRPLRTETASQLCMIDSLIAFSLEHWSRARSEFEPERCPAQGSAYNRAETLEPPTAWLGAKVNKASSVPPFLASLARAWPFLIPPSTNG